MSRANELLKLTEGDWGFTSDITDFEMAEKIIRELEDAIRDLKAQVEGMDWLEQQEGCALISDDFGHWAVSGDGMQNIPENPPDDIVTAFMVDKEQWKPSIREAIRGARETMEDE
jgi:hypothetical protein